MLAHEEEFGGAVPDGHNHAVLVEGRRGSRNTRARPKSVSDCRDVRAHSEQLGQSKPPILTWPGHMESVSMTMTLDGFMSRWMTQLEWM